MKVVREYQPCERCKGTGLETHNEQTIDCLRCNGYGKLLITVQKEDEDGEKPE